MKTHINRTLFISAVITGTSLMMAAPSFAQDAPSCGLAIYGTWIISDGQSRVSIDNCHAGHICGNISYITTPDSLDTKNADPALRTRKILGVSILSEFTQKKENRYKGKIYNPRDGKTYNSKVKLNADKTLNVKGCVGPFCKTQTWTRPADCNKSN